MNYTIRDLTDIADIPTAKLIEIQGPTAVYRLGNGQIVTLTILPTLAQTEDSESYAEVSRERIPSWVIGLKGKYEVLYIESLKGGKK